MARLLRPTIDLATKLRVLLRQLGDAFPDDLISIAQEQRCLGTLVAEKQAALASLLGCEASELQLDHDPALENREKLILTESGRKVRAIIVPAGGKVLRYFPDANDPEFLIYRSKPAHLVKTNVANGPQYSDRVLAKRERKRVRREQEARGLRKPKPRAKIQSASRWPKGRKINNRAKRDA